MWSLIQIEDNRYMLLITEIKIEYEKEYVLIWFLLFIICRTVDLITEHFCTSACFRTCQSACLNVEHSILRQHGKLRNKTCKPTRQLFLISLKESRKVSQDIEKNVCRFIYSWEQRWVPSHGWCWWLCVVLPTSSSYRLIFACVRGNAWLSEKNKRELIS